MEESPKKQFDESLGGAQSLPSDITIFKFAAARAKEIEFMQNCIQNPTNTKLIFQKLPIHMRRRVMSHNAKRLPRRLRSSHISQLTKSTSDGKLPEVTKRPSRKYRRRPSNLQSEYMRRQRRVKWLETHIWHAKRFHMIERWGYKLPDRPCDKAFRALYRASAKFCLLQDISYYTCLELSGNCDLIVSKLRLMYSPETGLGFGAKSLRSGSREGMCMVYAPNSYPYNAIGEVRFLWGLNKLWIWAHPSFALKLFKILEELFETSEIKIQRVELSRFRLTGPLTIPVLKRSLRIATADNISASNWYRNCISSGKFWNELDVSSPGELSACVTLSLVCTDPRFNMPKKRMNLRNLEIYESTYIPFFPETNESPIWDSEVRIKCLEDKLSNAEICNLKSQQLVPGEGGCLLEKFACFPLILVQRPGSRTENLGYGSGFDIIFPSGWGLSLWRSLIMWGARAGGLREDRVQILEQQRGDFLQLPDTESGQIEAERIKRLSLEKYFRLPPNKRVNYTKYGIVTPFHCDWDLLTSEWCSIPCDQFYVLRNQTILRNLSFDTYLNSRVLVGVTLKLLSRGLISQFAIICLPKESEIIKKIEPTESVREDPNQDKRKLLRSEHLKLLKKLKRGRARIRKDLRETGSKTKPRFTDTSVIKSKHFENMKNLYFPEVKYVRYSCDREVMGYVTHGDFSFVRARTCAVGYVTLQSLVLVVKNKIVLVRDRNSRQYHFAEINIIT